MKLTYTIIFSLGISILGVAQNVDDTLKVDNQFKRVEFERLKLVDIETKEIPPDNSDHTKGVIKKLENQNLRAFAYNNTRPRLDQILDWNEMGPQDGGGRTRALAIRRISETVVEGWAGGISGGLWKNNNVLDPNEAWHSIDVIDRFISCITLNHINKKGLCFGTGEGYYKEAKWFRGKGIYETEDEINFVNITADTELRENFEYVNKLVYLDNEDILAATMTGLFLFERQKSQWIKLSVNSGLNMPVYDIERNNNGFIYVAYPFGIAKTDSLTSDLWEVISNRDNFMPEGNFEKIELAISSSAPNSIYALLISNSEINYILKSTDSGQSWSYRNLPYDSELGSNISNGQGNYSTVLEVSPFDENTVIVGGINLFRSTTGGRSWSQISYWNNLPFQRCYNTPRANYQYVHADQHIIAFDKTDPNLALVGNDGGIFITKNALSADIKIADLNFGYNTIQFYSCDIHPTKDIFVAGSQDNGTRMFTTRALAKAPMVTEGWDGTLCFIDQKDPKTIIASYPSNNYYVSRDEGLTFSCLNAKGGLFVNPTAYDSLNKNLYSYAFGNKIYKWLNLNSNPKKISIPIQADEFVTFIKLSSGKTPELFIGTNSGSLVQVSDLESNTPKSRLISSPLPKAYISCIEIQKDNPNHILITFSNYGAQSIWESNNVKEVKPTWTSIEGNLASIDVPIRWITLIPEKDSEIKAIIATEFGVFTTNKIQGSKTKWIPNSTGISNLRVDMLSYRQRDKTLIAATHGRGLFWTKLESKPVSNYFFKNLVASAAFNGLVDGNTTLDYGSETKILEVTSKKDLNLLIINKNSKDSTSVEIKSGNSLLDLSGFEDSKVIVLDKTKKLKETTIEHKKDK